VWNKVVELPAFGKTLTLYTFGPVLVVAFLVAAAWLKRRAVARLALDPDRVFNVAFALLFLGIAGARLLYALVFYEQFTAKPLSFLAIWNGGLVWYGGLLAGLLWLAWWLPRHPEMKGFEFLDVLARAACLGLAIGWIAPLLAGDQFGEPTDVPWGIPATAFQDGTPALSAATSASASGEGSLLTMRLHPVQVYEAVAALLLFLLLGAVARRSAVAGRVTAVFLMVHAVVRAFLDTFRWDDRGELVPGFLSTTQFLSVPIFFAGVAIWLVRRPERSPRVARAPSASAAGASTGRTGGRP
jgi:phosphatidylglycerol:prolipoprotein diacylglycerol transferase